MYCRNGATIYCRNGVNERVWSNLVWHLLDEPKCPNFLFQKLGDYYAVSMHHGCEGMNEAFIVLFRSIFSLGVASVL